MSGKKLLNLFFNERAVFITLLTRLFIIDLWLLTVYLSTLILLNL